MIKVSKHLKDLAKELDTDLYLVGGYVRNSFLNLNTDDIDIASCLTVEQIFSKLECSEFLVKIRSAKMGTVEIFCDDEVYQHTTFRKDSYVPTGKHSPNATDFIKDIKEDAKRRDFTINSIYYNIKTGKLIDFYNGIDDIKNKTIKCVETPDYVFSADGLRLLRLVRFASEFNFNIEDDTYKSARKFAKNLKSISGERKRNELLNILYSNKKYKTGNPLYGIKLLFDLNLFKYIFDFNNSQTLTFDTFDFKPILSVKNSEERLHCFLLCLFEYFKKDIPINTFITIVTNKNALNFSKRQKELLTKLARAYYYSFSITNIKKFIFKNYEIIDLLCQMLFAFENGELANNILNEYKSMKQSNTPFKVKDLKINGNDLKSIFNLQGAKIKEALDKCLLLCVQNPKLNDKKLLIEQLQKIYK